MDVAVKQGGRKQKLEGRKEKDENCEVIAAEWLYITASSILHWVAICCESLSRSCGMHVGRGWHCRGRRCMHWTCYRYTCPLPVLLCRLVVGLPDSLRVLMSASMSIIPVER